MNYLGGCLPYGAKPKEEEEKKESGAGAEAQEQSYAGYLGRAAGIIGTAAG